MRSRLFHRPAVHRGSPTVSWLEMLFDLVFVAVFSQVGATLGDLVQAGHGINAFVTFVVHLAPIALLWSASTFHANHFDVDDVLHRSLVLLQMLAVWAAGLTAPLSMNGPDHVPYALSVAFLHITIGLLYLRLWWQTEHAVAYGRYWSGIYALCTTLWLGSTLLPPTAAVGIQVLAFSGLCLTPLLGRSIEFMATYPPHTDHLTQRYGVMVLLTIGASVFSLLRSLSTSSPELAGVALVAGATCLTVTTSVWWIYFDDVAGAEIRQGRGSVVLWLYAHLPLLMGLVALGPALANMASVDLYTETPRAVRFLLTLSLATVLASVALIDSVTNRRDVALSDRARVQVRLAAAALVALMGVAADQVAAGTLAGVVVALSVGQVVFDIIMVPFESNTDTDETPLRSFAEERAARRTPVTPANTTVRRGGSSSSNDLYYFFLEGSWLRSLLLLTGAFLILNLVFAALFLLDANSVAGAQPGNLLDAFAFSVQTLSTIGYGALSPQTPYGHLLVTIEAAVGIIFTALATGIMFAKASRPIANVLFSEVMVLNTWHGKPTLHFRVANARNAEIVDATVSFTVLLDDFSPEGQHLRRLHDLKLVRSRTPLFVMSWTIMHVIDDDSPLKDIDWGDHESLVFIVTLIGHDSAYGQTAHARHAYRGTHIHKDHQFVNVLGRMGTGELVLNLDKLHDTRPINASSSAEPPAADEEPRMEGPPPS